MTEIKIILLKVWSGQTRVTAGLTSILANYDAIVLDIGQADIHDTLSLGILFEIQSGSTSGPVLKIYCLKRMSSVSRLSLFRFLSPITKFG
jgi:predicted amino acid-binding ACT domain protein